MDELSPEEVEKQAALEREKHYLRRRHIAKEIVDTERTYIGHLSDIVELYLRPMERGISAGLAKTPPAKIGKDIPADSDFKALFTFILDIYNLNTQFFHSIEEMMPHIEHNHHYELQMGKAFEDVTESFKFYSAFVNSYDKSLDALARVETTLLWADIMKQVDQLERPERPLTFEALLVTPIQRIPRYLLLLTDLLRHTPKEHPDFAKLHVIREKMEEVANHINNEKSKFDNLNIIHTLSNTISGYDDSFLKPGRRFLREGVIYQYTGDTLRSKQRYAFLFSDIILLTQSRRGSGMPLLKKQVPRYHFLTSMMLFACKVIPPEDCLGVKNGFKLQQADGTYWILYHNHKRDLDSWYQSLKDAIEEAQASCLISHHARTSRSLPPLTLGTLDEDDDGEGQSSGVSKFHTHRTVTVSEPNQRSRETDTAVELPPIASSASSGPSRPPSPTLPPPLDLPMLSSALGPLPRPQLLPFSLPSVPARSNRHLLQPVSLSSDAVATTSSSMSPLTDSGKKHFRRTLSELMASQLSNNNNHHHGHHHLSQVNHQRHNLDNNNHHRPVAPPPSASETAERERRNSSGSRKEAEAKRKAAPSSSPLPSSSHPSSPGLSWRKANKDHDKASSGNTNNKDEAEDIGSQRTDGGGQGPRRVVEAARPFEGSFSAKVMTRRGSVRDDRNSPRDKGT